MRCASPGLAWFRMLLGALLAFTVSEAQAQGTIKIGMIAPLSGPFAQIGKDMVTGTELFTGRLAIQFVKQYNEAGLKARIPLIGGGSTTDEAILPSMGCWFRARRVPPVLAGCQEL